MTKNIKFFLILVVGILLLLTWAPWMNNQAIHDRIFKERAKI